MAGSTDYAINNTPLFQLDILHSNESLMHMKESCCLNIYGCTVGKWS